MQKSARIVILLLLFIYLFTLVHRGVFDFDIWLHLKAGEWILQNRAVPQNDIFSFTIQGRPWVDHSWLFQILTYLVYSNWGDEGLISLETIIICLAFLVLSLSFYHRRKDYYIVAITIFFAMYASTVRYNIRPDIFSLLFFSIYLSVLRQPLTRKSFYGLLFIQMLWVNIHGYFFLGPLLVLTLILQEFIRRRFQNRLPWQWNEANLIDPAEYGKLKLLLVAVTAVNLLNPQFINGALYPLWVFKDSILGKNKIFFSNIVELRPVFKTDFIGDRHYFVLLIFSAGALVLNRKKLKFSEVIGWLILAPFSFVLRNITYFIFLATNIICSNTAALRRIPAIFFVKTRKPPWFKVVLPALRWCAVLAFALYLVYITQRSLLTSYFDFREYEPKSRLLGTLEFNYPKQAVDFLLKEKLPQRMFNDFNSGAYLIGRAFPERLVFVDGRTELYGEEFHKNLEKILAGDKKTVEATFEKYNITAVFLSYVAKYPANKLMELLHADPAWKIVYLDDSALIFLKDTPENKALIKKFQIDFNKWDVPAFPFIKVVGFVYPHPYVKRAQVLDILKMDEAVLKEANEALRIMPNCGAALNLKGKVFLRREQYEDALINLRAAYINTPRNPDIIYNLGRVYAKLKEYEKAIKTFKYALKIMPRDINTYKELAAAYKENGEPGEAHKALKKAHSINPEDKEISAQLGATRDLDIQNALKTK
jgi:tetratricopeptide (TPR) repeat protein